MKERIFTPEKPQCTRTWTPEGYTETIRCNRYATNGGLCGYCFRKSSPSMRQHHAERELEKQSQKLIRELTEEHNIEVMIPDGNLEFNPFDALLEMAQETMEFKDICKVKLSKLKEDEWRWEGERVGEQLRSEVALYERAIQRCTDTLIKIARLGIEERMMRVAERQQAIMERAIVRTMQDLDLPLEMQAKARQQMVLHLRAL